MSLLDVLTVQLLVIRYFLSKLHHSLNTTYLASGSKNHYHFGKHHPHKDNKQDSRHGSKASSIATDNSNPPASYYSLGQLKEDEQGDEDNTDYYPGIYPAGGTEGIIEVLHRYHGAHH